ncbi:MAG: hypothetical protein PF549_01090 [Patescibacteria group bacterium]|jgi:hypothetical protein|nr:hypothetical protein [Patescibacteria group bacterium]
MNINKKRKISKSRIFSVNIIFFAVATLCVIVIASQAPLAEANDTCSAGTDCSDSGGGCEYCSVTNRSTGAGYYTGGQLGIACSPSSPVSCWIDAGCWRNNAAPKYGTAIFGATTNTPIPPTWLGKSGVACCPGDVSRCPAPPVCKVATCSSNNCSTANAPTGTSCGTNKQCSKDGVCVDAPNCVAYENTVNSGGTVVSTISATNANEWSAVCTNFECDSLVCEYVTSASPQSYSGNISGTATFSNLQYYNGSFSPKTRECVFTVTDTT